jgi:hypothetical protein
VPTVWAGKYWKVFIDTAEHLEAAIAYVENNPVKEGKPKQFWSFVTPLAQVENVFAQRDPRRERRG